MIKLIATDQLNAHFDMLSCYVGSAMSLHANVMDGIADNLKNSNGKLTNEILIEQIITAFYLSRHALELAIKALIKITTGNDEQGHNLEKLWEKIPKQNDVLKEIVKKPFDILKKYDLLENEELFRYHINKRGIALKNLIIERNDFDLLVDAIWSIRQIILECAHLQKDFV